MDSRDRQHVVAAGTSTISAALRWQDSFRSAFAVRLARAVPQQSRAQTMSSDAEVECRPARTGVVVIAGQTTAGNPAVLTAKSHAIVCQ